MIGEALRVAEAYWIETDFEAGRTDLLALLRDAVAGSSEPSS